MMFALNSEFFWIILFIAKCERGLNLKIPVVYKNGKEDSIEPKFLDILLHIGEIQEFRRSDHWVNVSEDPIRSLWQKSNFQGNEKRQHHSTEVVFSL